MEDSDADKRESQPSTQLNPEDVRRERPISSKRSHSGHLSTLTTARQEIGTLLPLKNP